MRKPMKPDECEENRLSPDEFRPVRESDSQEQPGYLEGPEYANGFVIMVLRPDGTCSIVERLEDV